MPEARATRKQAEGLRLKIEPVRDSDGKVIHGEWVIPCRTGAILYPYDTHLWAADLLSTYWHNRLIRDFGEAMRHFGDEAEVAVAYDPGDEHTLHFSATLLDEVAKTLKAKRRGRRSASQVAAAKRNIEAYWADRRAAAG